MQIVVRGMRADDESARKKKRRTFDRDRSRDRSRGRHDRRDRDRDYDRRGSRDEYRDGKGKSKGKGKGDGKGDGKGKGKGKGESKGKGKGTDSRGDDSVSDMSPADRKKYEEYYQFYIGRGYSPKDAADYAKYVLHNGAPDSQDDSSTKGGKGHGKSSASPSAGRALGAPLGGALGAPAPAQNNADGFKNFLKQKATEGDQSKAKVLGALANEPSGGVRVKLTPGPGAAGYFGDSQSPSVEESWQSDWDYGKGKGKGSIK